MTKTLPGALTTLLAAQPIQLARIFHITLNDGTTTFLFTDHDEDIAVGGDVYLSSNAIRVLSIEATNGNVAQNTEFRINYVDGLSADAAIQGSYDNAIVRVDILSYANPNAGSIRLITGFLQRRSASHKLSGQWHVKGLLRLADGLLGEVFSQECRNNLGDARCTKVISASPETQTATVSAVQEDFVQFDVTVPVAVNDDSDGVGYYTFGLVKFTGAQFYLEILHSEDISAGAGTSHRITLAIPSQSSISVTDTLELIVGCDKRHKTCVNKFANVDFMQAEPFAPQEDNAKAIT